MSSKPSQSRKSADKRSCKHETTDKSGVVKKCGRPMFAQCVDPHTYCSQCRGRECNKVRCVECLNWSDALYAVYRNRNNDKKARNMLRELRPQDLIGYDHNVIVDISAIDAFDHNVSKKSKSGSDHNVSDSNTQADNREKISEIKKKESKTTSTKTRSASTKTNEMNVSSRTKQSEELLNSTLDKMQDDFANFGEEFSEELREAFTKEWRMKMKRPNNPTKGLGGVSGQIYSTGHPIGDVHGSGSLERRPLAKMLPPGQNHYTERSDSVHDPLDNPARLGLSPQRQQTQDGRQGHGKGDGRGMMVPPTRHSMDDGLALQMGGRSRAEIRHQQQIIMNRDKRGQSLDDLRRSPEADEDEIDEESTDGLYGRDGLFGDGSGRETSRDDHNTPRVNVNNPPIMSLNHGEVFARNINSSSSPKQTIQNVRMTTAGQTATVTNNPTFPQGQPTAAPGEPKVTNAQPSSGQPVLVDDKWFWMKKGDDGEWSIIPLQIEGQHDVTPSQDSSSKQTTESATTSRYLEVLTWMHEEFPETDMPTQTDDDPGQLRNLVQTKDTSRERRPEVRLPSSAFHQGLDKHLRNAVLGKRKGRSDKPLNQGSFITPPAWPGLYEWWDEPLASQAQQPSAAWTEFIGRSSSTTRRPITLSEKDFSNFETSARKSMLLSSFTEWFVALLSKLIQADQPDISKITKVMSSLGQVIDQTAREAAISVANLTLKRRDQELTRLPSLFPQDLALKLRASSFRGNDLFDETLVASATPVAREAASHRQLMNLLDERNRQDSRRPSSPKRSYNNKRQSSTSTDRGGKRQRSSSEGQSSRQQQRGRDRQQQQQQRDREPQQQSWNDRPSQGQQQRESGQSRGSQPFRGSTFRGRGTRGGRGRR